MKPDWKDAPQWANYLAQDGDGTWVWFENKPEPRIRSFTWQAQGAWVEAVRVIPEWLISRESRPTSEEEQK